MALRTTIPSVCIQLADSNEVDESAACQQLMDMIGGIPVGRPGSPEEVAESC